jgi:DNA-binding NarL/FixJ family response regulator
MGVACVFALKLASPYDHAMPPLRVVLADDSVLFREGLASLLTASDIAVVAQTGEADAIVGLVAQHEPDVLVVDVRMPPSQTDEGLRAARAVRAAHPGVAVVVLSQHIDVQHAVDLLGDRRGGIGYLLKDRVADVGELRDALDRVAHGGVVLDPDVVAELVGQRRHQPVVTLLTPRERDVLELMADGSSNRAIARRLVVTEGAVEKHVHSIFRKLGLQDTPDDHRRVLAVVRYLDGR